MKTNNTALLAFALITATALAACARAPDTAASAPGSTNAPIPHATSAPASVALATPAEAALPLVVVSKNPNCGCCGRWVEHMREAGFPVEVHDLDNMSPVKERVGVPPGKGSCHTAEVAGYFIEGHVPAEDVKRLLAERPDAKGLVLPGMPAGSPGMELPDGGSGQSYWVELVARDGTTTAFAHHGR